MSEYWVSKKKYFCKYCEIYIADDAPSRQQHESGLRHKGNKERFVRSLYKTSEKRKHDLEEEKREMARVEKAAQAAFAQDVGSGLAKASTSSLPPPRPAPSTAKPAKPANVWSNYSTAESLGYVDPDAERAKAEAERRKTQGVAGEWQVVTAPTETPTEEGVPPDGAADASAETTLKRRAEAPADDDDTRAFKVVKKSWGAGLGEIWDPGMVPIKIKTKKKEAEPSNESDTAATAPSVSSSSIGSAGTNMPQATAVPKWTSRGWTKPGEAASKSEEPGSTSNDETHDVKPELELTDAKPVVSDIVTPPSIDIKTELEVKVEESTAKLADVTPPASMPPTTGMFKKRKAPPGTAGSRQKR